MVVFTCNHCGDSLQKPRVEKHYMFACRTTKSLTCVDCFQDFKGEEYVAHTKCVTEAQRYSAKGSLGDVVKKGEVKQANWVTMIKQIVTNDPRIPIKFMKILNSISTLNNIPRKKAKFINFIKASTGGKITQEDSHTLWCIIEKHRNELSQEEITRNALLSVDTSVNKNGVSDGKLIEKNESEATLEEVNKAKYMKRSNLNAGNNVSAVGAFTVKENGEEIKTKVEDDASKLEVNEEPTKKKKKKNKADVSISDNINKNKLNEEINMEFKNKNDDSENVNKRNKKRNKNKTILPETSTELNVNHKEAEQTDQSNLSFDSKRILDKKTMVAVDVEELEILSDAKGNIKAIDTEFDNVIVVNEKRRKKKSKNGNVDGTLSICAPSCEEMEIENKTNGDREPLHGKKRKVATDEENKGQEVKEDQNGISKFFIKEKVLDILKSKNSISVSKLEKKVIKAYRKAGNMESGKKVQKKLHKKLKTIKNVKIVDNNVELILD